MTKLRGHDIETKDGEYVYSDNKKKTATNWKERPCGECGLKFTPEGHDGCLGTLKGVMNACCGHGIEKECYVQMNNGKILRGGKAKGKIALIKKITANVKGTKVTYMRKR